MALVVVMFSRSVHLMRPASDNHAWCETLENEPTGESASMHHLFHPGEVRYDITTAEQRTGPYSTKDNEG